MIKMEKDNNCDKCGLKKSSRQIVWGEGEVKSVFIIGMCPGETEDKLGIPFVGASGKLVRNVIDHRYYVTNVVKRRPTDDNTINGKNRDPTEDEIKTCVNEHLIKELQEYKPTKVILLGKVAQSLVNKFPGIFDGIEVVNYTHPSYSLRTGKTNTWELEFGKKILEKGEKKNTLAQWFK